MKRTILVMVLGLALGLALPPQTARAVPAEDQEYLGLVTQAMKTGGGPAVDWVKLRALYTKTSFYDPYGGAQAIWYSLQRAKQNMVYEEKSPESVREYNMLLAQHFAHFRSHEQALEMIEQGRLPESERSLHDGAVKNIRAAILSSGDGNTQKTAYRVIDPAEEGWVFKPLHYQTLSQEFQQEAGHFWDVVSFKNPATGETLKKYFNVDEILNAPPRTTTGP